MGWNPTRAQIEMLVKQLAQRTGLFARVETVLAQVRSEQSGSRDEAGEAAAVRQLRALG
ncbi:MAG: hypothetical protein LBI02_06025 [Opitutaceae bacterium]|jgi:hypothetical protein|nr:hypothetical protein [Opitutaceae bacterium]